jgi:predicted MFS family arabinose efflux permease
MTARRECICSATEYIRRVGPSPSLRPTRTAACLAALAAATFVFVTTETQPVALLSPMASGLRVSESSVGLLMTAYAAVAAVTAVPLTVLASRIPRRRLVIVTVSGLVGSQAVLALAPSYGVAIAARLTGALAHGVFWSVIAQVAAALVPRQRAGQATAAVFAGNSLALVAGTPLVSALGVLVGWRAAVAAMGTAALLAVAAIAATLPALGSSEGELPRRQLVSAALTRPRLLVVCGVTVLLAFGQFVAFTYLGPIVRLRTGLTGTGLSVVLFAYGAAGIAGVAAIGSAIDRRPRASLLACCAAVLAALTLICAVSHSIATVAVAVVAWGFGFTALPICLQRAVVRVAPDVPDTGSAVYVVAFQVGIGGGALAGAALLANGALASIPVVALALIAAGSSIAAVAGPTFGGAGARRNLRASFG